ncbi:hypothetical protein CFB89_29700 [Burkholderia sp. AU16741]|nr:hypothetical protein CFB89_29700 [Burkholderia sp. AU16741]
MHPAFGGSIETDASPDCPEGFGFDDAYERVGTALDDWLQTFVIPILLIVHRIVFQYLYEFVLDATFVSCCSIREERARPWL